MERLIKSGLMVFLVAVCAFAQTKPEVAKTIFRDSEGNLVSNNEFVDIRMANPHYLDATIVKTLDDGTIEFRLQKIPQEGMRAPDFRFTTLDGRTVTAADVKGKVVVFNFWFIGCHVCRAIKPDLNKFRARFRGNEDVIFIAATADPVKEVEKFSRFEPFDYLQAAEAGAELKKFIFSGYPRNIVVSKTGEIVYWRTTVKAWDKFESVVRAELAK